MNMNISRLFKINKNREIKFQVGNAQTIGKMDIQSNYFSTNFDRFPVAVLANGGIDSINGRKAAVIAVETVISAFSGIDGDIIKSGGALKFLDTLAVNTSKIIKHKIYNGKTPNVSLSVVCINDGDLYYYTIGDNRLCICDKNAKELKLLEPHLSGGSEIKHTGKCRISPGESVILMSGGVYGALNEIELLRLLSSNANTTDAYGKAQKIIQAVNIKNLKEAKNATILLLTGCY